MSDLTIYCDRRGAAGIIQSPSKQSGVLVISVDELLPEPFGCSRGLVIEPGDVIAAGTPIRIQLQGWVFDKPMGPIVPFTVLGSDLPFEFTATTLSWVEDMRTEWGPDEDDPVETTPWDPPRYRLEFVAVLVHSWVFDDELMSPRHYSVALDPLPGLAFEIKTWHGDESPTTEPEISDTTPVETPTSTAEIDVAAPAPATKVLPTDPSLGATASVDNAVRKIPVRKPANYLEL
jgi:hypothetical protein